MSATIVTGRWFVGGRYKFKLCTEEKYGFQEHIIATVEMHLLNGTQLISDDIVLIVGVGAQYYDKFPICMREDVDRRPRRLGMMT